MVNLTYGGEHRRSRRLGGQTLLLGRDLRWHHGGRETGGEQAIGLTGGGAIGTFHAAHA